MANLESNNPGTHTKKNAIPKDTTVLVVEDNVSNFVLIARMLGYLGIHCEWKTS
jgi:two-component system cell cycle response regulator DivK